MIDIPFPWLNAVGATLAFVLCIVRRKRNLDHVQIPLALLMLGIFLQSGADLVDGAWVGTGALVGDALVCVGWVALLFSIFARRSEAGKGAEGEASQPGRAGA